VSAIFEHFSTLISMKLPKLKASPPKKTPEKVKQTRRLLAMLLVVLALLIAFDLTHSSGSVAKPESLSSLLRAVNDHEVKSLTINDTAQSVTAIYKNGHHYISSYPLGYGAEFIKLYSTPYWSSRLTIKVTVEDGTSLLHVLLFAYGPILLILAAMFYFLRGGAISSIPGIGAIKSNPNSVPDTRFSDVGGVDEVVEELVEVVDYLHNPEKYKILGAKVPHGILLVGPPGTGKTLLAKAVAGEAGVPFYAISGSDFVDTFVGVGARRVREVFKEARKAGKAIVFIDELDAVGKVRSGGPANGATEESDRTLNALLVEMDGFVDSSVIVLGATNRPEVLDSALLRSGRFERKITIGAPDRRGRLAIFQLLTKNLKLSSDVDLDVLAGRTSGLSGADLAFLVNEAALQGARVGGESISQENFLASLEVVMLGRARTSAVVSSEERELTAWHEAGHAVASLVLPAADDPVRVSIIPRGPAGGVTWMDSEDRSFVSRDYAMAQLTVLMAGRAGEMVHVKDNYTSGIAGDLRVAGRLATLMVTEWAMSDLGAHWSDVSTRSDDTVSQAIDRLLDEALGRARSIMVTHSALHQAIAEALLAEDTIDRAQLMELETLVGETGLVERASTQ
jgi:cell division protease FtsH